jgi:quaternary ammonium compound-resistance protein SugE
LFHIVGNKPVQTGTNREQIGTNREKTGTKKKTIRNAITAAGVARLNLWPRAKWNDCGIIHWRPDRRLWKGFMAWIYLIVAGCLEVVWAIGMKQSHGFTRLWPSVWTMVAMFASFGLLSLAMRVMPLGNAYAIWTGIGAVGSVIAGIILFHEPAAWPRLACIGLILAGIIGLKVLSAGSGA